MTNVRLLREGLQFISQAVKNDPQSSVICIQDGKLQYIGRGLFIQVENEATKSLPNASFPASTINTFCVWLSRVDGDTKFEATLSRSELSITGNCHDDTGRTLIRLPLVSFNEAYHEVDEIVLKPLLVNKYEFELEETVLYSALGSLRAVYKDSDSHIPAVSILVESDSVVFGSENRGVSVVRKIPLKTESVLPKWQNSYVLDALMFSTPYRYDAENDFYPVKISYTDNTKTLKSPLMLQYENGVTVIAAPIWT